MLIKNKFRLHIYNNTWYIVLCESQWDTLYTWFILLHRNVNFRDLRTTAKVWKMLSTPSSSNTVAIITEFILFFTINAFKGTRFLLLWFFWQSTVTISFVFRMYAGAQNTIYTTSLICIAFCFFFSTYCCSSHFMTRFFILIIYQATESQR